jgi:hypothetical protein
MNINYLEIIPVEIIHEILFNLHIKYILSLCVTNKYMDKLGNDDDFWKIYLSMTDGVIYSWKRKALSSLSSEKLIPIYDIKNNIIGEIVIRPKMIFIDMLEKIRKIAPYTHFKILTTLGYCELVFNNNPNKYKTMKSYNFYKDMLLIKVDYKHIM